VKQKLIQPQTSVLDPVTNAPVNPFVYYKAKWVGANDSGIYPIGDKVLLLPDFIARKTAKGIELTDDRADREDQAITTGVLVAVGEGAFAWNADRVTPFVGRKPQPGDRVTFEKFTGQVQRGKDGIFYRLLDDRSVGAIVDTATKKDSENGSH